MEFTTKTVHIRQCRRCKSTWTGERIELEIQERIEFVTVIVAHCPACSDNFAKEIDRPTYNRTGKKLR